MRTPSAPRAWDTIACTSVNDVFVMDAWGKDQGATDVVMLADGNGAFAESLGLTHGRVRLRHGHAQPALRHGRQ